MAATGICRYSSCCMSSKLHGAAVESRCMRPSLWAMVSIVAVCAMHSRRWQLLVLLWACVSSYEQAKNLDLFGPCCKAL